MKTTRGTREIETAGEVLEREALVMAACIEMLRFQVSSPDGMDPRTVKGIIEQWDRLQQSVEVHLSAA